MNFPFTERVYSVRFEADHFYPPGKNGPRVIRIQYRKILVFNILVFLTVVARKSYLWNVSNKATTRSCVTLYYIRKNNVAFQYNPRALHPIKVNRMYRIFRFWPPHKIHKSTRDSDFRCCYYLYIYYFFVNNNFV